VLKISPGHDHNDYHIARKLGLPILNAMNKDGTLNDVAGIYRYVFFSLQTQVNRTIVFLSVIFLLVRNFSVQFSLYIHSCCLIYKDTEFWLLI